MKTCTLFAVLTLLAASLFGTASPAASPAASGSCHLLSADTVSNALHVAIVRVEPSADDQNVCEYSIKGKPSSAGTDHSIAMVGAMSGQTLDPQSQKLMQGFGNAVLGGGEADSAKNIRHPGETPILVLDVHPGDAAEMNLNRQANGFLQAVTPISGLGDEAFSSANSMMFVRKGGKVLRIIYTGCPCASKDIEPLARQIVGAL